MDRLFAKETEVRKRWGENEMKKKNTSSRRHDWEDKKGGKA
jgi:hypothetical protein